MVSTSMVGSRTGWPSMTRDMRLRDWPPVMAARSALVPPTSSVTAASSLRSRQSFTAAVTPPASPEVSMWAGFSRVARGVATPPSERMNCSAPAKPISRSVASSSST
jgi:hypothetical protein